MGSTAHLAGSADLRIHADAARQRVQRTVVGSSKRSATQRLSACVALPVAIAALFVAPGAAAYSWPLKPFNKQHPVRGTFGDPRYHLDGEGQLSAFHFGVDIAAPDGTPVYAVEPGVVVRRHATSVTIGRASGRRFGYWHIRPLVRSGTYVRMHQLLGHVLRGWGHLHFAESIRGAYRNPLRRRALTPFNDHTVPIVASVQVLNAEGSAADNGHIAGVIDITADVYDTPPLALQPPWDVARLAPAAIWWNLIDGAGKVVVSSLAVDFDLSLPSNLLYGWVYASGSYQNKPHRPGHYVYRVANAFDTTSVVDGAYTLEVGASDTRNNVGTARVAVVIANGVLHRSAIHRGAPG
jgi:murein DD-endopeptidase MepM/ murein hydrolase activator NlpD